MADLSNHDERPSLSPEALLRALGVVKSSGGVEWEARLRAVSVVLDLSDGSAGVAIPEAGFSFNQAGTVGFPTAFEIIAGIRGASVLVSLVSAPIAIVRFIRFDNKALAEAANPYDPPLSLIGPAYSINGGVLSSVTSGFQATIAGPQITAVALQNATGMSLRGARGFWLPPGDVLRITTITAAAALELGLVIREPLAP